MTGPFTELLEPILVQIGARAFDVENSNSVVEVAAETEHASTDRIHESAGRSDDRETSGIQSHPAADPVACRAASDKLHNAAVVRHSFKNPGRKEAGLANVVSVV